MSGYAIFNIKVNNAENYKEYVEKVKPTAEKFGGEYVVRGGDSTDVEGRYVEPPVGDISLGHFKRFAVLDKRDIAAGAAHIHGHYMRPALSFAQHIAACRNRPDPVRHQRCPGRRT